MSKKKDKRTNNNLQNVTQKAKDRVTRIPHKSLADTCAPEESAVPAGRQSILTQSQPVSVLTS
jgi:uncharacterized FlgJ-related protein